MKVERCASGTEAMREERVARAQTDEAVESEIAEARREAGRSPSLVTSRAEEKRVLEDLRKGGVTGVLRNGGIVGGTGGGIVGVGSGLLFVGTDVCIVLGGDVV